MTRVIRIFALAATFGCVLSAVAARAQSAGADTARVDIAILPIANYTERAEAHTVLLPGLHYHLRQAGITYVTSDSLRPFLRERRIRSRGWVGRDAARQIAEYTGARYILLGSWDVLRTEPDPEVGLSLRVLDAEHLSLVASVSVGAAGLDYTRALGLGRVTSLHVVADRVLADAIEALFPLPEYREPDAAYVGCYEIAVVPLDNISDTPNAGSIVTDLLISALMSDGYFVIEPGFVRELGLERGVINHGGVDEQSARAMREHFNACRVVTGEVEEFSLSRGLDIMPEVAFGIRAMSPETGNIYMIEELEGAGDDGEWLLQLGRTHAIVPVVNRMLKKFMKELKQNNREDILYGQHR